MLPFDFSSACVWDCETNGLMPHQVKDGEPSVTKFHCAWIYDLATDEWFGYRPHQLREFVAKLKTYRVRIGHNVMGYDEPIMEFFRDVLVHEDFQEWDPRPDSVVLDTLLLAKAVYPADDLLGRDMKLMHQGRLPGKLLKRQSLEAWGFRLGEMKGDYSAEMKAKGLDPWAEFNEPMFDYNRQDVASNLALWKLLLRKLGWDPEQPQDFTWSWQSIEIEHRVHQILLDEERWGYGFDYEGAMVLKADLENRKAKLEDFLKTTFGSWWAPATANVDPEKGVKITATVNRKMSHLPDVTIRRFSEKTGKELKPYVGPPIAEYPEGNWHVPIKRVTFNPSSRQHLGHRLMVQYGWSPTEFGGAKGKDPVVDEGTIKRIEPGLIPEDVRQAILDYFKVDKSLGQLANGTQSWLNNYRPSTGAIHGRVDGLGTITHRGSHSYPNKGQVPSVSLDEKKDENGKVISKTPILGLEGGFGWECRSLWRPRKFRYQIGTDASGLELLCLGHYLAPLDGGAFAARVSDPLLDIHQANASITALTRAATKTVTYAFLYGSGPLLIGIAVGVTEEEVELLWNDKSVQSWMRFMKKLLGNDWKEPSKLQRAQYAKGKQVIAKFLAGITGLDELRKGTSAAAETRGWVKGLDGRKLVTRKAHAALNTLLQSCGAIICKYWMVLVHEKLTEKLGPKGTTWAQMAWVHDELQIEYAEEWMGEVIGQASKDAIREAGEMLGFRAVLKADFKLGRNWAECH